MRLLRLEIQEFGRLEGMTLSFGAGMNLIEGENESGKSTLLAALRFLLYGFPRRNSAEGEERDRRLSYRTRRAAGSLLLEAGGKEYRIYRAVSLHGSAGSEQAGEELAVTALPEGSPVPLGGKTPGEVLLGLPARLFDSSLCVRQSEIDRVSSADVGDCVSDLLGAGGEGAARSAGRLLETARRRLLHAKGRGGRIAELEDEEAELSERLRQARACAEELKGLRQRERELCTALAAGREQASALQARLGEHRLLRELEEREELRRLEAEAQSYQAALDRAPLPPLGEEDAARLSSLLHKKRGSEERVARLTATRTTALQENNNSVKKTPPRGAMSGQSTGASSALGRLLLTAGLLLLVAAVLLLCLAPVLPEKRSSLLIRSAFSSVIGALLLLVRHLWCSKGTPTAQEPANGDFDEALSAAREEDLRLAAALREMLLQALGSSADTAEEGERLLQDAWRREGEARAARLAASEGLSRAEERIRALRARLSPLGEEALRAQLAELRTQNTGVTSPLTRGEYASCEGTAGRNTPEQEPPPPRGRGSLRHSRQVSPHALTSSQISGMPCCRSRQLRRRQKHSPAGSQRFARSLAPPAPAIRRSCWQERRLQAPPRSCAARSPRACGRGHQSSFARSPRARTGSCIWIGSLPSPWRRAARPARFPPFPPAVRTRRAFLCALPCRSSSRASQCPFCLTKRWRGWTTGGQSRFSPSS